MSTKQKTKHVRKNSTGKHKTHVQYGEFSSHVTASQPTNTLVYVLK